MRGEYRNTWHVLHFILTLFFLPYALVWILRIMLNNQHNAKVDRIKRDEEMRMMREALARGRNNGS